VAKTRKEQERPKKAGLEKQLAMARGGGYHCLAVLILHAYATEDDDLLEQVQDLCRVIKKDLRSQVAQVKFVEQLGRLLKGNWRNKHLYEPELEVLGDTDYWKRPTYEESPQ